MSDHFHKLIEKSYHETNKQKLLLDKQLMLNNLLKEPFKLQDAQTFDKDIHSKMNVMIQEMIAKEDRPFPRHTRPVGLHPQHDSPDAILFG